MAWTSIPRKCQEMLEDRVAPYHGKNTSWIWPAHHAHKLHTNARKSGDVPTAVRTCPIHGLHTVPKNFPKIPENQATSLPSSKGIPFMACTPCPRNCQEMPENQAASLTRRGRGLHTMSQKLPKNALKLGCIPTAT
ncbi:Hypothetical predicted protein [Olea europaea subsp. europaea]|uniref:Uncharacterized protein n=1 Tax=Olea europaea subsp. europaea TaxID=158383 RepID=A0A8S0UD17_OLEEU|nr:Hypothetical predicted protein [Olea europaea subsp. europaea]